jgi:hypothetical protein
MAAPAALAAQAEAPAEAVEAAQSWLVLMDADDYARSWEEGARSFQAAVTADGWAAQFAPLRAQLGSVGDRELAGSERMTDPPGAPAGEYLHLQYTSTFSGVGRVSENVVLVREAERGWRVAGYFLQPAG